jgi:cysteinyl-tRNA synthetase
LDKKESLTKEDLDFFKKQMKIFVEDILGLQLEQESAGSGNTEGFIELLLQLRAKARENKDWASSDLIRDQLKELGVIIKDGKEGASWEWA